MKTKLVLSVILTAILFIYGCSDNEDSIQDSGFDSQGSSSSKSSSELDDSSALKGGGISQPFHQAQQEVLDTFGAIALSITAGAGNGHDGPYMDQLISFHAYGDKFTEFNDGHAYDSADNEENERTFFGETVDPEGVIRFAPMEGTLKVAVYYGNVANLTFISDFHLMINGELHIVNNLITLLFVKTRGEWKMVHEHHSPFN